MFSRLVLFLSAWVLLACSATGQQAAVTAAAAGGDDEIVATIDGEPIRLSDLGINGELTRLRQEEYQAKLNGVESKIAEMLLRKDADRQGLTFEAYLEQEIGAKIEGPTDEQIQRFYDQQKARIGRPLEEVRSQIERVLQQELVRQAHNALVEKLREGVDIKVTVDPPRVEVAEETVRVRGPENAPVSIIEFSDFQCPFCRQVQPALAELQTRYGDKIRWSFKDLPLSSIHPQAQGAAEAARCAADQGKFWEFRAAMFASTNITPEFFQSTADGLGVNSEEFKACVASGRHREAVLADSQEAEGLGISGTPAFVINGILLSGAQPLENFVSVIDRELARSEP
jgi:protein-disulfide isomerase